MVKEKYLPIRGVRFPVENGYNESFNGKLRDELLRDQNFFL